MITVLTGDNRFEVERALQESVAGFDGRAEKIDGSQLERKQLPDLLMGGTLFADKRLVIIRDLSENKTLWMEFGDWVGRVSDDVQLVLVEPKLDKRTKTYKALQKTASIREWSVWSDRDTGKAEQWVANEAAVVGPRLDKQCVGLLVRRVGVDQWRLHAALQKLVVFDTVTPDLIEEIIDASPLENVFDLFESALRGNRTKVRHMIATLALSEDPYRLFGLMSGQAFQLAVLASTDTPSPEVARALGAHPFAVSKLVPFAKKLGKAGSRQVVAAFAEADVGIKTSVSEPWLLIERALMKITRL